MSDAETTQDLAARSGLTVTSIARQDKPVPRFEALVSTEVEVEIDPDDLHDAGWHHENECAGGRKEAKGWAPVTLADGWTTLTAAVESLHRQAHGPGPVLLCRSEPCASLSLDQLRGAA